MTVARRTDELPPLRAVLAKGHLRMVVLAVLVSVVTLTISGAVLLRGYARSNLELSASILHYAVEPALYFGDPEALHEAVTAVVRTGDLRQVQVFDAAGVRLLNWEPDGAGGHGRGILMAAHLLVPAEVEMPIVTTDGEVIGKVRVAASPARLLRYALLGLLVCAGAIGLAILATRMLTQRLQEDVVAPIEHVAQVADAVRHQRNFSLRIAPSPIAEINRFALDFNALLVELQGWHDGFMAENQSLAHLAEHDALTGLGNRLLFDRELQRAIANADATARPFTLLFVDFNGFKQINDTHGHIAGDMMLAEFGRRLRECLRAGDRAFRMGGDEFAVLLDPASQAAGAAPLVDCLNDLLEEPVRLHDGNLQHISISIGVSTYPRDAVSALELVGHADRQMYLQKKGSGRGADRE